MILKLHRVSPDGNCLLRAFAVQLKRSHIELRDALCREYIKNKESYQGFFEDLDSYVEKISKQGVWCDEMDIAALANATQTNVELFVTHNLSSPYTVYKSTTPSTKIIRLLYSGNHYDALTEPPPYCETQNCEQKKVTVCPQCAVSLCTSCAVNHRCKQNFIPLSSSKENTSPTTTYNENTGPPPAPKPKINQYEEMQTNTHSIKYSWEQPRQVEVQFCASYGCEEDIGGHCGSCGVRMCKSCILFHNCQDYLPPESGYWQNLYM